MEAQDQLERKYISRKEEHRALEMQNYMGLCRNTGTFDPNRLKPHNHRTTVKVSESFVCIHSRNVYVCAKTCAGWWRETFSG